MSLLSNSTSPSLVIEQTLENCVLLLLDVTFGAIFPSSSALGLPKKPFQEFSFQTLIIFCRIKSLSNVTYVALSAHTSLHVYTYIIVLCVCVEINYILYILSFLLFHVNYRFLHCIHLFSYVTNFLPFFSCYVLSLVYLPYEEIKINE